MVKGFKEILPFNYFLYSLYFRTLTKMYDSQFVLTSKIAFLSYQPLTYRFCSFKYCLLAIGHTSNFYYKHNISY